MGAQALDSQGAQGEEKQGRRDMGSVSIAMKSHGVILCAFFPFITSLLTFQSGNCFIPFFFVFVLFCFVLLLRWGVAEGEREPYAGSMPSEEPNEGLDLTTVQS